MTVRVYIKENNSVKKQFVIKLSYISLVLGMLLLFWSFYPVIAFEIFSYFSFRNQSLSPVPGTNAVTSLKEASSVLGSRDVFSNNLRDFTQASLWFPNKKQGANESKLSIKEFYLSIPKLNIVKAKVMVGGDDLSKSLIHFLPTSLPGEYGNVAIFGHSTLPQMYNPKDYKTIFTYLPSLEKNDKLIITINNVQYEYEVYEMFVVKPEQVSVLEQKFDAAYITLITCVPPGTYWNRLVVRARLTKLP